MPVYAYKALNAGGIPSEGAVEAATEAEALDLLRDRNLRVTAIEAREGTDALGFKITIFERVTQKDLVVFSRQLAVMVGASLPLVKALKVASRQTSNSKLRRILFDVSEEVEGGVRLSDALAKHQEVFGNFYVNMVRSGETSGKLEEVLRFLADQQERDYDMRNKVKGAMIYPIFVIVMLFVIGTVMMIFVIPKLTAILKESGVELPFATRMLIAISDFFAGYWYLILIAVVGAIVGVRYAHRTPGGKRFLDELILRIPVFGPMFRKIYLVRMMQGLSTLISGGVDMVTSLKVVAGVVGNEVFREAVQLTVQEVGAGNSLTSVWRNRWEIPPMVPQMLSVGEDTGNIQPILERMSEFYTREINNTVSNLSTAIEPLIMVIMGVAVGIMVAAIILPMYTLAQQM